ATDSTSNARGRFRGNATNAMNAPTNTNNAIFGTPTEPTAATNNPPYTVTRAQPTPDPVITPPASARLAPPRAKRRSGVNRPCARELEGRRAPRGGLRWGRVGGTSDHCRRVRARYPAGGLRASVRRRAERDGAAAAGERSGATAPERAAGAR